MKNFRITAVALVLGVAVTSAWADKLTLKDGCVLEEIVIGDMGKEYFVVIVPRSVVKAIDFTRSSSPEAEAALQAYERNILKTYPFEEESIVEEGEGLVSLVRRRVARNETRVKGRMLSKGEPAEGLQVALRRIQSGFKWGGLSKEDRDDSAKKLFETVTDADGNYEFVGIPLGSYDLLWKQKGKEKWTRRLSDRPDVVLESNDQIELKDVEIARKPVN